TRQHAASRAPRDQSAWLRRCPGPRGAPGERVAARRAVAVRKLESGAPRRLEPRADGTGERPLQRAQGPGAPRRRGALLSQLRRVRPRSGISAVAPRRRRLARTAGAALRRARIPVAARDAEDRGSAGTRRRANDRRPPVGLIDVAPTERTSSTQGT